MVDRVFVVTGATSGIGKALLTERANIGETVVLMARNADRGLHAPGHPPRGTEG